VKCFFVRASYSFINLPLRIFSWILFSRLKKNSIIKRILIFRTGELGDNICAIPAINNIRLNYTNAHIFLLYPVKNRESISFESLLNNEIVDEFVDYSQIRIWKLIRFLRAKKIDLFIEMPQEITTFRRETRNLIFAKLIGCKYAFGFQIDTHKFLRKFQELCLSPPNEVDRLLNHSSSNGISIIDKTYPINFKKSEIDIVEDKFFQFSHKKQSTIIAVAPGSKLPLKRWPEENFFKLIQQLLLKDFKVVLIGGEGEKYLCEALSKKFGKNILNLSGILSPIQSIYAIKKCNILISNDSAAMHMASITKTPIVALFSSWRFANKWFPDNPFQIVLRKNIHCSLCFNDSCMKNICMEKISVSEVQTSVENLLESFKDKNYGKER